MRVRITAYADGVLHRELRHPEVIVLRAGGSRRVKRKLVYWFRLAHCRVPMRYYRNTNDMI